MHSFHICSNKRWARWAVWDEIQWWVKKLYVAARLMTGETLERQPAKNASFLKLTDDIFLYRVFIIKQKVPRKNSVVKLTLFLIHVLKVRWNSWKYRHVMLLTASERIFCRKKAHRSLLSRCKTIELRGFSLTAYFIFAVLCSCDWIVHFVIARRYSERIRWKKKITISQNFVCEGIELLCCVCVNQYSYWDRMRA